MPGMLIHVLQTGETINGGWKNSKGQSIAASVSPIKMGDDEPSDFDLYTPQLGENTVEVMKAYGYTEEEIQALIDEKVVVSNPKA